MLITRDIIGGGMSWRYITKDVDHKRHYRLWHVVGIYHQRCWSQETLSAVACRGDISPKMLITRDIIGCGMSWGYITKEVDHKILSAVACRGDISPKRLITRDIIGCGMLWGYITKDVDHKRHYLRWHVMEIYHQRGWLQETLSAVTCCGDISPNMLITRDIIGGVMSWRYITKEVDHKRHYRRWHVVGIYHQRGWSIDIIGCGMLWGYINKEVDH